MIDLSVPADFYARRAEGLLGSSKERNVLDLGVKLTPEIQAGTIDYAHRLRKGWALWAHGEAGLFRGKGFALGMGGLRIRW